jgi:hypothetical protein
MFTVVSHDCAFFAGRQWLGIHRADYSSPGEAQPAGQLFSKTHPSSETVHVSVVDEANSFSNAAPGTRWVSAPVPIHCECVSIVLGEEGLALLSESSEPCIMSTVAYLYIASEESVEMALAAIGVAAKHAPLCRQLATLAHRPPSRATPPTLTPLRQAGSAA